MQCLSQPPGECSVTWALQALAFVKLNNPVEIYVSNLICLTELFLDRRSLQSDRRKFRA